MGRTVPTITDLFHIEEDALNKYRRALRIQDKAAFDDLMVHVQKHLAECGYAAYDFPVILFLLSMLLEEHKKINSLQNKVEGLLELMTKLEKKL